MIDLYPQGGGEGGLGTKLALQAFINIGLMYQLLWSFQIETTPTFKSSCTCHMAVGKNDVAYESGMIAVLIKLTAS